MADSSNSSTTRKKPPSKFWNALQLIMILVVFSAPLIGAYFYEPKKFNNYGDIYSPVRPVDNLIMWNADGEQVELDSFRRKWVFLVTAQNQCDQPCEDNLLKIRQLRAMQNNDMSRIRTLFLHTGLDEAHSADMLAKYRPMEGYRVELNEFIEWTKILWIEDAPVEANKNRFYIIDPAGNLMMSYPEGADPNIIKKDIKRLLKASQIG